MQRASCDLIAGHAAYVDPGGREELPAKFKQCHAAIFPGGLAERKETGTVAVQKRIGHCVAARDPLIPAPQRDRYMREDPRLLRGVGHFVENDPARLFKADPTLDHIFCKGSLEA